MRKKVLLLSSGLDSVSALFLEKPDYAIFINYGIRYNNNEQLHFLNIKKRYEKYNPNVTKFVILENKINLSRYEEEDFNLPLRNLYLIMLATNEVIRLEKDNITGLDIMMITQKDEMSIPDRTIEFLDKASDIISYLTGKDIKCYTPFADIDKTDILKKVVEKCGRSIGEFVYIFSYSCYYGSRECGNCPACFRKWVAGINNDFYQDIFLIRPNTAEIAKEYLSKIHKYSNDRQKRIITALQKAKEYYDTN